MQQSNDSPFRLSVHTLAASVLSIANGFISHPAVRLQRHTKLFSSSTPSEVAVPSDSFAPDGPSVNIKFDNIVNMRDLCTASATVKVVPSKIFRTGCVSKASEADVSTFLHEHHCDLLWP